MDSTINKKKNNKHNKTNDTELFIVNKQELMAKISDILQQELKSNSISVSESVSVSDDNDSENRKKRRNKKELFKAERAEFISKINDIIKIEENNYAILYEDLIENDELKNFLIDNMELIRRIYASGSWGYVICHLNGTLKKNEVNLMKCIYKDDGYKFASKIKILSRNGGIKKKHTQIHFIKPSI